jgi:hypothetical protein
MSSLETRLRELAVAIGSECKKIHVLANGNMADNSALTTAAKANLVAAINEVNAIAKDALQNGGVKINDASSSSTTETYSITKILNAIAGLKTFLDTNGDGKVNSADVADSVPYTGVTGKPSSFPPSAHDASLITSGTIDPARIPGLNSNKSIVSSGDLTALTAPQQTQIDMGTLVTTADGRRWTYTGSGDKTLAASYVETADITPEWSVIANKPSTLAGYGISDAQPIDATLSALAGLTTVADRLIYSTGADSFALAALTTFARSILDDTDAASARTTLDVYGKADLGNPDTDLVAVFNGSL